MLSTTLLLLSLSQLTPAPSASDREVTIKALREEITDLSDQKSGIGYVFPVLCAATGVGLAVVGGTVKTGAAWANQTLLIGGGLIAVASTAWFVIRLVRAISLSSRISEKEDQLEALERQRLQVSFAPIPGGWFAGLSFAL